jgi:hypothetical protein
MIFIVLLVLVFGMVIATMQFGSAPNGAGVTTASPRAALYAQNMETWHQAAMLAAQNPLVGIAKDTTDCPTAGTPCAISLNPLFWNYTTSLPYQVAGTANTAGLIPQPALYSNWREYQPVVPIGDPTKPGSGGWQSFLIRNISGTDGSQSTNSYVLTVFRGFGCGSNTCTSSNVGSGTGGVDNTQIANALAKTIQDRMGVGTLACSATGTGCSFTRAAAYDNVTGGATTTTSDKSLYFPLSAFTNAGTLTGTALPASNLGQVLNGLPAIMTRVGVAGAPAGVVQCPAQAIAWTVSASPWPDTDGSGQYKTNAQADPSYDCYANFPATNALLSGSTPPVGPTISGLTSAGSSANPVYVMGSPVPSAACNSDGTWSQPTLPSCTQGAQQLQACATTTISWDTNNDPPSIPSSSSTYCAGPLNGVASGLASPTSNTAGYGDTTDYTGSASATCDNGTWEYPSGNCTPRPLSCDAVPMLLWTVGSFECSAPIGPVLVGGCGLANTFSSDSGDSNFGSARFCCSLDGNGNPQLGPAVGATCRQSGTNSG